MLRMLKPSKLKVFTLLLGFMFVSGCSSSNAANAELNFCKNATANQISEPFIESGANVAWFGLSKEFAINNWFTLPEGDFRAAVKEYSLLSPLPEDFNASLTFEKFINAYCDGNFQSDPTRKLYKFDENGQIVEFNKYVK
jgi:hypothetical protein